MSHLELRPARTVRLRYEFANCQPSATGVWVALPPTAPGQSVTSSEVALAGAHGLVDSRTLEGNELWHVELDAGGALRLEATVATAERMLIDGPGRSPPGARLAARVPARDGDGADGRRDRGVGAADAFAREAGYDAVVRARAFFDELVEGGYRYVYPPANEARPRCRATAGATAASSPRCSRPGAAAWASRRGSCTARGRAGG